jgi:hypothetical protein
MPGTDTTVDDVQVQDGPDEDFDAGFAGLETPTETPETTETQVAQDAPEQVTPAPETPAAPEYVQITKEELQGLKAGAAAVEELRATLASQNDKTFGKIGGLERLVKELQSTTPAGEAVELSEEDMAEFAQEYPELANMQRAVLNKALGKIRLRGTGTAEGIAPEKLDELVTQRLQPALQEVNTQVERLVESRLLAKDHPDWREVVDAGNPESKNAYRTWLATQPAAYQSQVNTSTDSGVIGESITKFKASVKTQAAINQRQSRIDAAVTPRGVGGNSASTPSDDDEFNAGFTSG